MKNKNYWQYKESEVEVIWMSNQIVSINDVELDVYDFRKGKSAWKIYLVSDIRLYKLQWLA